MLTYPLVTIVEFDARLDAQRDDSLWELVAGRIAAMTNPTGDHEQFAGPARRRLPAGPLPNLTPHRGSAIDCALMRRPIFVTAS
ncbi:MAG TPA: hypothetical protein VND19_11700 [Acetobacteraceae bacterium]|nr:hypothetical protein [Acetobacteraceae bacterium]